MKYDWENSDDRRDILDQSWSIFLRYASRHKISDAELARRCDVHPTYLSRIRSVVAGRTEPSANGFPSRLLASGTHLFADDPDLLAEWHQHLSESGIIHPATVCSLRNFRCECPFGKE